MLSDRFYFENGIAWSGLGDRSLADGQFSTRF
jgi:hypothetical protein